MREEIEEYESMLKHVMRNCKLEIKSVDEIIEYLVKQCYYIDIYNDVLQESLDKIKSILGKITDFEFIKDELPF